MSRIAQTFARSRAERRPALVGYLTAFDPSGELSLERALRACEAGLDVLELGVPFSDPTADGPVVQDAMVRALEAGASLEGTLLLAGAIRQRFEVPIVLFSYANPLVQYGPEDLAAAAVAQGIDALLGVDVPPEHSGELREPALRHGLDWIGLVAPTSSDVRMSQIAAVATGFIYAITLRGVTGSKLDAQRPEIADQLTKLRRHTQEPIVAGFGIRTPEQASALGRQCDGVVVGSALIRAAEQSIGAMAEFIGELRAELARC